MTEYFIAGTEPTEESPRFQKVNDVTSLKATSDSSSIKLTWDFKGSEITTNEFWDKYYSDRVFGNGKSAFIQQRNSLLGDLGYYVYLKEAKERCMNTSSEQTGLINDIDKFYANLEANCVPVETIEMDFNSYDDFLDKRRKMMAAKIKKYYYSL